MKGSAYPFVVARNRTLDWRPIVAPAVLIDTAEDFGLVLETGDQHPAPVTVRCWAARTSTWILAYRSIPALPGFIGAEGTQPLTDRFGRVLFLTAGVAVPERREFPVATALTLVEQIHPIAVAAFSEFWGIEDEAFSARPSHPIPF